MNPIEEYLQEKRAGFGSDFVSGLARPTGGGSGFASALGSGISGAAALGLAGATIGAAGKGVQKLYDAATKTRDFKSMLEANPDLMQMQQEKPKQFNQMFTSLRTFTPEFSRDPVVAGTYMRQMMENPIGAGGIITQGIMPHAKLTQRGELGTTMAAGGFKEHFKPQTGADMFAEEELGRKRERAPLEHEKQLADLADAGSARKETARARQEASRAAAWQQTSLPQHPGVEQQAWEHMQQQKGRAQQPLRGNRKQLRFPGM